MAHISDIKLIRIDRAEQKTEKKPIRNRNRSKPVKTEPRKTDPKPKPKIKKPNRVHGFGSGYWLKPNRKKPNRTDLFK